MIISHKNKFIFIHCRKVAGSSISAFLSSYLGPDDLQIGTWVDAYNLGILPNLKAKKDLMNPLCIGNLMIRLLIKPDFIWNESSWVWALNGAQKEKYKKVLGGNPVHPLAIKIKNYDSIAWDKYFKFCFVRNPFERVVSDYLWRTKMTKVNDISFLQYLQLLMDDTLVHKIKPINYDNWQMYTIDNKISVDFIGRYENLHDDMKKVCDYLALPFSQELFPTAKKIYNNYNYRDFYGTEEKKLVEKIFYNEINYFKYTF